MTTTDYALRLGAAREARRLARAALAEANRQDPDGRRFVLLETPMSLATDTKTVLDALHSVKAERDQLRAENASLRQSQLSPEDRAAEQQLAQEAATIDAAPEPAPAPAPTAEPAPQPAPAS